MTEVTVDVASQEIVGMLLAVSPADRNGAMRGLVCCRHLTGSTHAG